MRRSSDIRPGRDEEIHLAHRTATAVRHRHAEARRAAIANHCLLR